MVLFVFVRRQALVGVPSLLAKVTAWLLVFFFFCNFCVVLGCTLSLILIFRLAVDSRVAAVIFWSVTRIA